MPVHTLLNRNVSYISCTLEAKLLNFASKGRTLLDLFKFALQQELPNQNCML